MGQSDLHVTTGDVFGPSDDAGRLFTFGEGWELETLDQLVDVATVLVGDELLHLANELLRARALHVDGLLGHDDVDPVGPSVDMLVDPTQLDLELVSRE